VQIVAICLATAAKEAYICDSCRKMEHFICDEEGLKRFVNVPFALNRQQLEKNKQNADSAPPGKISADAHSYCAHQCIVEYFVFHIHNTWTHIGRNFDLIRYFKRA